MKRDEIRDKNWKQEVLDKGYFIFQGLLNQDDIPVIKERVRFIAAYPNAMCPGCGRSGQKINIWIICPCVKMATPSIYRKNS